MAPKKSTLEQWLSNSGPWANSTSITWELVRHENSQILFGLISDLQDQTIWGWGSTDTPLYF